MQNSGSALYWSGIDGIGPEAHNRSVRRNDPYSRESQTQPNLSGYNGPLSRRQRKTLGFVPSIIGFRISFPFLSLPTGRAAFPGEEWALASINWTEPSRFGCVPKAVRVIYGDIGGRKYCWTNESSLDANARQLKNSRRILNRVAGRFGVANRVSSSCPSSRVGLVGDGPADLGGRAAGPRLPMRRRGRETGMRRIWHCM